MAVAVVVVKSLVKTMIKEEVISYCRKHPPWRIPTGLEAESLPEEDVDWSTFRVNESISNRDTTYCKKEQCYKVTHPLFKHNVVLIKEKT